ncbi:glycosyltransferase family 2 protein [Fimbriimonas ginsengisoli]|uniref:Glucosyl-3-phosphoglycerate synthase n=1 Tax=Fimbriimonas ginsengisoli Gsoil 348 TaxID=661478 RepID=A0A068NPD2_FIMGI|nr:glycosyltransferase family 2 protein [Fimbriimonas ginsengisoli]AIE85232.1 glycosyl transferase family 2 [Fimbriimonas ginsengisoli Gsoil 348]
MGEGLVKSVAVIIPAFNEEDRILSVLRAVKGARLPTEIIVVSDGSTDRTAAVARSVPGVTVFELPGNQGKGAAMAAGVKLTSARYVAFVDADLGGLTPAHVDGIIQPLLDRRCDMCVGIFRGGKVWSDAAHTFTPYFSGQRALKREIFEAIPYISDLRLGIEYAINNEARRRRARVLRVVLPGVSNCHKEQKLGLVKGLAARTKMYKEIGEAMVKTRKRRKRPPRMRPPWLH